MKLCILSTQTVQKPIILKFEKNNNIIECANKKKINICYSCNIGACSVCTSRIICGRINCNSQKFLASNHIKNGFILACVSYSDTSSIILNNEESKLFF